MIGNYVRERRKELGLTKTDLADKIKCSQSYISLIESNKRRIGNKQIDKFAKALVLTVEEIKEHNIVPISINKVQYFNVADVKTILDKEIERLDITIASMEETIIDLKKVRKNLKDKQIQVVKTYEEIERKGNKNAK